MESSRPRRVVIAVVSTGVVLALWIPAPASAVPPSRPGSPVAVTLPAGLLPPPIAPVPAGSSRTGPLVGVTADDGSKIVTQKWIDSRTVDIGIYSTAMRLTLPVRVLVPAGWTADAKRAWPLALLLHGGLGRYTDWTTFTDVQTLVRPWDVLVALPEAGRTTSYVNYFRPTALGPLQWETFHTVELIQLMERGFGAGPDRAVAGLSAGGYGAIDYAARNPSLFRFAASYSGALSIQQQPLQLLILALDTIAGDPFARYGNPVTQQWNWKAHDPLLLAPNLSGVSLYVSSGYSPSPSAADPLITWSAEKVAEALLGPVSMAFARQLRSLGIPVTTDFIFRGTHTWPDWQLELHRSWPQLAAAIGATRT